MSITTHAQAPVLSTASCAVLATRQRVVTSPSTRAAPGEVCRKPFSAVTAVPSGKAMRAPSASSSWKSFMPQLKPALLPSYPPPLFFFGQMRR